MPQFQLDTSGAVVAPIGSHNANTGPLDWASLDSFTQGYIEALFFTEEESLRAEMRAHSLAADGLTPDDDESDESAAAFESLYPVGFSDLAPEALARIIADCEAFQRDNAATLAEAYARDYDAAQAGRDYWFTRNGHGVGFCDRDALEPQGDAWDALQRPLDTWSAEERALHARLKAESLGERLNAACRYQEVSAYLGDDGKVHLS